MHSSLKPLPSNTTPLHQLIFPKSNYSFEVLSPDSFPLLKTSIELNSSNAIEEISKLTKICHKNMINLKKIGKSKRSVQNQKDQYWLYYEHVPYALDNKKEQMEVEKIKDSLYSLLSYLQSQNVSIKVKKENIGLTRQKQIKIYIPPQHIIFSPQSSTQSSPQGLTKQVQNILNWYVKSLNQNECQKEESGLQREEKKGKKKLDNIDIQLETIRRKIKSVENKYQMELVSSQKPGVKIQQEDTKNGKKGEEKQKNNFKHDKIQQNINCINIFHSTNQIVNPNKRQMYYNEYDNESIDTYQMEMGDDYEMPNLKTNQRLRQTIFTDKKPWDTFTTRSPTKRGNKIHESAGQRDFNRIIENNKTNLEEVPKKQECGTVQATVKNNKNWPTETFRSDNCPNIQERVQEALAKTKNVMSILKNNRKSFSLQKV